MRDENVVLRLEGICKEFPGVKALQNVEFTLRKGEIHALMGDNGAGKSTLIKVLTGVYEKDGGNIYMSGVILSIGRIVGESAALIFTSGSGHSIPGSLVGSGSSAATLTVHMYILSNEGLHVNEAFASAVVLLALTFLINLVSDLIERRIAKKKG